MADVTSVAEKGLHLDELKSLGELAEGIAARVVIGLGQVAADGATAESQNLLNETADTAQRVQAALDRVFDAINEAQVYEPTNVEEILDVDKGVISDELAAAALSGRGLGFSTLRDSVPSLASMTDDELRKFVENSFPVVRQEVLGHLLGQGLVAEWVEQKPEDKEPTFRLRVDGYDVPVYEEVHVDEGTSGTSAEQPVDGVQCLRAEDTAAPQVDDGSLAGIGLDNGEEVGLESSDVDLASVGIPDVEMDVLPEIPQLQLSGFEQTVARQIVKFLSQFDERQNLRVIMNHVFGRSRLSRNQEGRLAQILDAFTEAGRLRSYGRTYGYKTGAELEATMGMSAESWTNGEEISEADHAMLQYIVSHAQNGEMNIGEIIRRHIGVEKLERSLHLQLIDRLNHLAGGGYLVHAAGSPWYGVGPKLQNQTRPETKGTRWQDRTFPPLQNLPLVFTPDVPVNVRDEAGDSADSDETDRATDAEPVTESAEEVVETEKEPVVLDEIIADVLQTLMLGLHYRMEELRKIVPSLKSMDPGQYNDFKQRFRATGIDQIRSYLIQQGKGLSLQEDGRARGKTYWIDGVRPEAEPKRKAASSRATQLVTTQSQREGWVRQIGGAEIVDASDGLPLPVFTTNDKGVEVMTLGSTTQRRILAHLESIERRQKTVGLKETAIANAIANISGWPKEVASRVAKALHRSGELRQPASRPHSKGTKVLTVQDVKSTKPAKPSVEKEFADSSSEAQNGDEHTKRWSQADTNWTIRVLDTLLTLKHVQQGMSAKAIIRELGIPEADQEDFRRSLQKMKAQGLVYIDKNANPNTRSPRSKKLRIPMVKIPNQAAKERWINDRSDVIEELRALEITPESVPVQ